MASFGPSLAGYVPGSGSGLSPEVWQQLSAMYNNPATYRALVDMGSPEYTDPASGLNFVPKFKEIAGNQIFDGGTVYKIKDKGTYDTPGDVYDAGGKLTTQGFNIHHDAPNFMDKYGHFIPMLLPFAAAAAGIGGAAGAGATTAPVVGSTGALTGTELGALGSGGLTTAEMAGVGSSVIPEGVAFTAPTVAEMATMTGAAGGLSGLANAATSLIPKALQNAGSNGFDWTKLIGPGLSAVGGIAGANAASNAADAQLTATREAQAKLEPWYKAGGNALNRLQELLGIGGNASAADYGSAGRDFGMADFNADPGYAFRKSEQEQALQRAASASGGLGSGKYLKDAMNYSGGLASQEYNNSFNRFQTGRTNKLNPLQSLAGQGQSTAQTIGDLSTQGGNAIAAGKVGQANALTNAITQGYSMYANSNQMDQNNNLLASILRR